ncbi:MAG: hypothetical protein KC996_04435 [Phycisphaerales bacterium]|nr:hypothetical protein [Phycisphaerales bacterium]
MHTNPPKPSRLLTIALASLSLLSLVGCKSASTHFTGRVIAGTIGQAMVVGPNDERLQEPGIPGLDVVVLQAGGSTARGTGVLTQAMTDELGNFEITIPRGKHPANSVTVRVRGDQIFSARSQTFLPTNAQKLLCTVITRDGYTPPAPTEPNEE